MGFSCMGDQIGRCVKHTSLKSMFEKPLQMGWKTATEPSPNLEIVITQSLRKEKLESCRVGFKTRQLIISVCPGYQKTFNDIYS